MERALLERKRLDELIAAVRGSAVLYAPSSGGGAAPLRFLPVSSQAEIDLQATNSRLSVKGLFFPQRETLMSFHGSVLRDASSDAPAGTNAPPAGAFVVFGVRPCDARSLTWLDRIFGGEAAAPGKPVFQDPYYAERRAKATVISLACDSPCESCFCTSVGGDPYGTEGADLLASATASGADAPLLFEAVSAKGRDFLQVHAGFFGPAGDEEVKAREDRAKAAASAMPGRDLRGVKAKLDASFDSPLWDMLTRACLGCGVCTYLCPTCHCFDITDEKRGSGGVRIRTWDSCQYPLFTQHASGHNPRPAKKQRMRQRIMHKYSYTVETAGTVFCSGCGRCVRYCPVNLDIRRMLAAFEEAP